VDDTVRKAGDFLLDMRMEFTLQHPLGINFVKTAAVLGGKGPEQVLLYMGWSTLRPSCCWATLALARRAHDALLGRQVPAEPDEHGRH
jgi:hypothetical protein